MQALGRIKTTFANFIQRLRLALQNSETLVLNFEVTEDSNSEAADSQTTQQTLYVKLSNSNTALQLYGGDNAGLKGSLLLTEETLTVVLNNHPNLNKVRQLVVTQHTLLYNIPMVVGKMANLTLLDLSGNKLQDLPWSIVYMTKLKILNLSHNRFFTVPPIVGHLTTLEELILSSNYLEYLPTSLLHLGKLKVLQVSGNERLVAPPLDVCKKGLDAVFTHLRKRCGRHNLWSNDTQFYSVSLRSEADNAPSKVKGLLELCVASVLQFNIDFFSPTHVPPPLKRHLYDRCQAQQSAVRVAKCSKCKGFFSTEARFDAHDCRQ